MKIKRNLKIAIHARKKLVSFFCSSLKETPTNTINNNNKMAEEEKREETGVLYATLHEASSLPDMDSYFSSGGGKSDPYVVVLVDGVEKERSTTFTDCEDPVWNKDYSVPVEGRPTEVVFQVWDEDRCRKDDFIGAATFSLDEYYSGKKLKKETLPLKDNEGKPVGEATITISLSYISTTPTWKPHPKSHKRALVIGINYLDSPKGDGGLDGCVNDAHHFREALISHFGFEDEHIRLLVDEGNPDKRTWPTKKNILEGIHWLTQGASPGDSLVFNYSGHGTQVKDKNKDEEDGMDEAICPCDKDTAGVIIDDELKKLLVDRVSDGVRVTCVMDCCHSGTILDLPFQRIIFETSDGEFRENSERIYTTEPEKEKTEKHTKIKKIARHQAPAKVGGRRRRAKVHGFHKIGRGNCGPKDVILISGCEDSDVSIGSQFGGESYGAMTWAFLQVVNASGGDISYAELVMKIRKLIIHRKLTQVPQLSTLRPFDINEQLLL